MSGDRVRSRQDHCLVRDTPSNWALLDQGGPARGAAGPASAPTAGLSIALGVLLIAQIGALTVALTRSRRSYRD